jgi:hypothetical protein
VKSFTGYDVNGYRFHTTRYEENRATQKTTNSGVCVPGTNGLDYHGRVEEIYELEFDGDKPLKPVMFKCHWFNPRETIWTPHLGQVEIREESIYQGKDVYIVAQQAMQVYYTQYANQAKKKLQGWAIVHQVSPHGKLPAPNDDDYNFNANTYDGEFYQEDGLLGMFEIVLLEASEMEVDNEMAHGPLLIVLLGMCLSGPDEGGLGQTSPGLLEPEQVGRSPPMVQGCPTRGDATTTMHSNVVELESQGPSDGLSSAVDSLAVGMPAAASAATMQNELEALV